MPSKDELIDIIDDTQRQLKAVRAELEAAQKELKWLYTKLQEAQERNRKLDWCLMRTTEELLK